MNVTGIHSAVAFAARVTLFHGAVATLIEGLQLPRRAFARNGAHRTRGGPGRHCPGGAADRRIARVAREVVTMPGGRPRPVAGNGWLLNSPSETLMSGMCRELPVHREVSGTAPDTLRTRKSPR